MTPECKDLIEKLLTMDHTKRLGAKGASEIKSHPWFKSTDNNKNILLTKLYKWNCKLNTLLSIANKNKMEKKWLIN